MINYKFLKGTKNISVVFMHGWRGSAASFTPIAENLPDYNKYILDLPGFGESAELDNAGFAEYVQHVADFIKSLNRPVYLVGHSFGGRSAIEMAAKNPDWCAGVILLDAACFVKPKTLLRRIWFRNLKKIKTALGIKWDGSKYNSPDYSQVSQNMKKIMGASLMHDTGGAARKICTPTLIIYGADDNDTPPWMGRKLHRLIKNSRLHILPNQDHKSVLTAGKYQVAALIKEFIK
ncbi:MAG: alpha/beta hydrolase [Rickettsiales bacterium]|jgi:pimeloyl-ACP methyl ester carboxylesterase|nr:alpha/beta hydrolase [Rickettsiales bacterium]